MLSYSLFLFSSRIRVLLGLLLAGLLFFISFSCSGQIVNCPANIDFELGNTSHWTTYVGVCCPIATPSLTATPLAGRHTITSGAAVDPFGGFPIVSPGSGTYSLKLGNSITGAQAEKVRYYVHVPSGSSNYALFFRYAVVFQDPAHPIAAQPRFEVNAFDSITGAALPCAHYSYTSTAGLPGFFVSPVTSAGLVYYKPWTTASIDLTAWNGRTVIIDFASGDCGYGGHFGYGYLDMDCSLVATSLTRCDSTGPLSLSAPSGYMSYQWLDSATFSVPYGTTQNISITVPSSPLTLAVIVTPYAGFGCLDTLYISINPSALPVTPPAYAGVITGPTHVMSSGTSMVLVDTVSGGVWSSSSSHASVVGGTVTALSAGGAVISYTVSNICDTDVATYIIGINCPSVTVSMTLCDTSGPLRLSAPAGYMSYQWFDSSTFTTSYGTSRNISIPISASPITLAVIVTPFAGTGCVDTSYIHIDASTIPPVTPPPNAGVISGPTSVNMGSTIVLVDTASGGVWSSSNGHASVVGGTVTGLSVGSTTISYTVSNICDTDVATYTINICALPLPISGFTGVSPCYGSIFTLSNETPGGTWSSTNTAVATIDSAGTGHLLSAGSTVISYSVPGICGPIISTLNIVVYDTPYIAPIMGPSIFCGGSSATLTDSVPGGTWSCSGVLAVSSTGVVTALILGTGTVTYTTTTPCGTKRATKIITVATPPTIGPTGGLSSVCVGGTITVVGFPGGGTWASDSPSIATVTTGGLVTGVSGGVVTLSYIISSGCMPVSITKIVTVNPAPPPITGNVPLCAASSITLSDAMSGGTWSCTPISVANITSAGVVTGVNPGTATVSYTRPCGTVTTIVTVNATITTISGNVPFCEGSTLALTVAPSGGTWTYTPATVATVSPTGVVSGIGGGTAGITYTTGCNSITKVVTVNPLPAPIMGNVPICVGGTAALSDAVSGGIWTCGPAAIATVNASGVLTGHGVGTARVTYTKTCGVVNAIVTVTSAPAAITGNAPFCAGNTISLSNATSGGVWSCTPVSVATVSATGVVSGISGGTAVVSYTTSCGSVTVVATVNPIPAAIAGNSPVCPGNTRLLSNTVTGGTWSCTPSSVATISAAGLVSAVAPGTAIVTYTKPCGYVTVVVSVVSTPGAILGNTPVCQGDSFMVSNSVPGGGWSISPVAIATVAGSGMVTGIAAGTATLIYTTSCGTVSATVTVNTVPGPISGASSVCMGSGTLLTDPVPGGVWSCAPSSVATISSAGFLSPTGAGTATVSYTNTCGAASAVVTVIAVPGPIAGNVPVCPGSTLALSNPLAGGAWSIAPSSVATIASSGVVTATAAGTATVSYTTPCGVASVVVTVTPLPGTITGNVPVCAGNTITLSNPLGGGTWSISPASVATISVTGVVSAIAPGTAIVSYTTICGAVSTIVTVTALAGPVTGNAPLCPGSTITLSNSLSGGTWSIATASVATISVGGVVTGVSGGTATVSYVTTCGTATAVVTVNPLPSSITGNTPVCPGNTITLGNSVAGGTWSCAPSSIATIVATGVVTGVAAGTATVSYVTTCGTVTATVTVNGVPGAITGNAPMCPGNSVALSNSLPGGTWSIAPSSVATITTTGVVTGVAGGTAVVSYVTMCGTVMATVTVNALPGAITGNAPFCPGNTITLANSLAGGTWSCAPSSVATIATTGVVTGVAAGTAAVSYVTTCGTVTATVTINAVAGPISGNAPVCTGNTITLTNTLAGGTWSCSPTSIAIISSGGIVSAISGGTATVSYTTSCGIVTAVVTVNPSPGPITGNAPMCPGNTIPLGNSLSGGTWSCAPASVATISSGGLVTAVAAGTATVVYSTTCGTITATVTVNAVPGPIAGNTPICVGGTITLSNSASGGTWSSVPLSVATIGAGGMVLAISAGTAMVSYNNTCGTASVTVTVNPVAGPIMGNTPVCPGSSITLSNSLPGGTWTCSPASVATISAGGVLTAVATGTAIVSYSTLCNTVTAVVTVNGTPGPITGNTPVCPGNTIALSNSLGGGIWSCTPASVATISTGGIVTGVAAGTAVVTYTVTCGSVTATITVNPLAGPITGSTFICPGNIVALSNSLPGGTWSCSPVSVATVSPVGVVSAITAGTAIVTYTTVCNAVTIVVTVNPVPGPITGNTPVCPGNTITLFNSAPGGAWTCTPSSIATISSTGVVSAIATGTAIVSYYATCGTVGTVVTVDPLPGPITGNTPVCQGGVIALGNSLPGGTWSTLSASAISISSTGIVTTILSGTVMVSYTTLCGSVSAVLTVNPTPGPISGNVPVCAGNTLTLGNSISGGLWTCIPLSVATINSSGLLTGISAGTATVTYTVGLCSNTAVVTVHPLPVIATVTYTDPVCGGDGGTITLSGLDPGSTYTLYYTHGSPVTNTMITTSAGDGIVTGLPEGVYAFIRVKNAYGCLSDTASRLTLIMTGFPLQPVATVNAPCAGDTLRLSGTCATSATTLHWAGPSGFGASVADVRIYPAYASHSGTYTVTAVLGTCVTVTTVSVTVHPQPVATSLSSNGPGSCYGTDGWIELKGLIPGETYTITYLANGVPVTVTITAGSAGDLRIAGLPAGVYTGIVVTSSFGCRSAEIGPFTLRFAGTPPPPVIEYNNPCIDQTLFLKALDAMPGGSYLWNFPDGGTSDLQAPVRRNVTLAASGIYTVTYSVAGCPATTTANVLVYPKIVLTDVTPDQTIRWGNSIYLNALGAIHYRWVPNDGTLDNPNINNPIATPTDSITYMVIGSDSVGCLDTAYVHIKVIDASDEFIPSSFTPNGDGLNDIFRIRNMGTQKLIGFSIYNRYGEQVYYNGYSPDAGWDGTHKGVPCDMGVYFYEIIIGLRDGTKRVHKGDVTLIR